MKSLCESYLVESSIEEKGTSKNYFVEGIFLQAELRNKNNRVYPKAVLESALSDYKNNFILQKKALGEMDHPSLSGYSEKEGFNRYTTVCLKNVSHVIEDLYFEGNNIVGRAKILDTESGRDIKALIDAGVPINVSSRGIGESRISESGLSEILPGFKIITVDIVANASGPNCVLEAFRESEKFDWSDQFFHKQKKFEEKEIKKIKKSFSSFLQKL